MQDLLVTVPEGSVTPLMLQVAEEEVFLDTTINPFKVHISFTAPVSVFLQAIIQLYKGA